MRACLLGASAVLLLPGLAAAAVGDDGSMVDALKLASSWQTGTYQVAMGLLPGMLILALLLEAFWKGPTEPKDFGGVLWRALVIALVLLPVRGQSVYGLGCSTLAGLSDSITAQLAPRDTLQKFADVAGQWRKDLLKGATTVVATPGDAIQGFWAYAGGSIYETLISIAMLLGQAAVWVLAVLAQVLVAMLYTVGPLALAFSVPRVTDSLSRWLRSFITILAWPVLSALMMAIIVKAGLSGLKGASPGFGSLAAALLMAVVALAVPTVASSLVGGSVGALSAGMSTLMAGAGRAAAAATVLAPVAAAGARAAANVAQRAGSMAGELVNPSMGTLAPSGPPGDVKWGKDIARVARPSMSPQADAAIGGGIQAGRLEGAGAVPQRTPFAGLLDEVGAGRAMGSAPAGAEAASAHGGALAETAAGPAPTSEPDSTWAEEGAAHHRPHGGGGTVPGGSGHAPPSPAGVTEGDRAAGLQFLAAAAGGLVGGHMGERAHHAGPKKAASPLPAAAPAPTYTALPWQVGQAAAQPGAPRGPAPAAAPVGAPTNAEGRRRAASDAAPTQAPTRGPAAAPGAGAASPIGIADIPPPPASASAAPRGLPQDLATEDKFLRGYSASVLPREHKQELRGLLGKVNSAVGAGDLGAAWTAANDYRARSQSLCGQTALGKDLLESIQVAAAAAREQSDHHDAPTLGAHTPSRSPHS